MSLLKISNKVPKIPCVFNYNYLYRAVKKRKIKTRIFVMPVSHAEKVYPCVLFLVNLDRNLRKVCFYFSLFSTLP